MGQKYEQSCLTREEDLKLIKVLNSENLIYQKIWLMFVHPCYTATHSNTTLVWMLPSIFICLFYDYVWNYGYWRKLAKVILCFLFAESYPFHHFDFYSILTSPQRGFLRVLSSATLYLFGWFGFWLVFRWGIFLLSLRACIKFLSPCLKALSYIIWNS